MKVDRDLMNYARDLRECAIPKEIIRHELTSYSRCTYLTKDYILPYLLFMFDIISVPVIPLILGKYVAENLAISGYKYSTVLSSYAVTYLSSLGLTLGIHEKVARKINIEKKRDKFRQCADIQRQIKSCDNSNSVRKITPSDIGLDDLAEMLV